MLFTLFHRFPTSVFILSLFSVLEMSFSGLFWLLFDDISLCFSFAGIFCRLFEKMQKLWSDRHCKYIYLSCSLIFS